MEATMTKHWDGTRWTDNKSVTFTVAHRLGGVEVWHVLNGRGERIASCGKRSDADEIVAALNGYEESIAALGEIVETDESFGGRHQYAAIARAALLKVHPIAKANAASWPTGKKAKP